jgi:hypothetical protein
MLAISVAAVDEAAAGLEAADALEYKEKEQLLIQHGILEEE